CGSPRPSPCAPETWTHRTPCSKKASAWIAQECSPRRGRVKRPWPSFFLASRGAVPLPSHHVSRLDPRRRDPPHKLRGRPPPRPPRQHPAESAAPAAAAPKPADDADKPFTQVPTACEKTADKICLPPAAFIKRLCNGAFPDVALTMFAKGTPWTRGYLR